MNEASMVWYLDEAENADTLIDRWLILSRINYVSRAQTMMVCFS